MDASAPPLIFSPDRRIASRRRMARKQGQDDVATFVADDMIDDASDRLAFMRSEPGKALLIGDVTGHGALSLSSFSTGLDKRDPVLGEDPLDQERPFADGAYDLIVVLGTLDSVNDLPGALIHLRTALAEGGLMMAQMVGAGSLPALRTAMLAADGDRPSARIHPMVDVRGGAQLLQRAGFARQVADSRTLEVRYGSLVRLVEDLRTQGLSNILADPAPPLTKAALARAEAAFADQADQDGKTTERFEILTLTGWR